MGIFNRDIYCKNCRYWSDFIYGKNQSGCYHYRGIEEITYNNKGINLGSNSNPKINKNNSCIYFKRGRNIKLNQRKAKKIMDQCKKNNIDIKISYYQHAFINY